MKKDITVARETPEAARVLANSLLDILNKTNLLRDDILLLLEIDLFYS
jgi:hypothetical protein